jgi:predicted small secreted protein
MRNLVQWKKEVVDMRNMHEREPSRDTLKLLRVARAKVRQLEFKRGIVSVAILLALMCQGCHTVKGICQDVSGIATSVAEGVNTPE